MDREVKEQYQVLIQAKDMGGQLGGLAGTTTVNITLSDVNDNPPRFSKSECCLRVNIQMKRLFNSNNNAGDNMPVRPFYDNGMSTVQLQRARRFSSCLLFVIAFHYSSLNAVISKGLFI